MSTEIPKRPEDGDILDMLDHSEAVARVAVEALRKITAGWLPGNCGQIGDEALARIDASGWKP